MAKDYADHYLLNAGIDTFPFDPHAALKYLGIKIKTYTECMRVSGEKMSCLIDMFGKDGSILYSTKTNKFCVIYNDKVPVPGRIRWTLTHELGHMLLNHFGDFGNINNLSKDELCILDQEADAFAAELLAPMIAAINLRPHSSKIYQEAFGLSLEAAENKESIVRWYRCYLTRTTLNLKKNFAGFIERTNVENNRAG